MKVLVAGPGTIGASLALCCAMHGHSVTLLGRREAALEKARVEMRRAADELAAAGLLPPSADGWNARIDTGVSISAASADAAIVLEAINEDVQAKCALFAELEAVLAPDVVIASSTSGLPVDTLAAGLDDPSRFVVAHFANPPLLMPMVEIVPGSKTRPEVVDTIAEFVSGLGKSPARLSRDIPGHIFNRIQFAMLREAIALVAAGVATPAEIDTVVKRGLALRLAEEGPLEKIDLAGMQLVHDVASYLFPDLDCSKHPTLLREMIADGRLGAAVGRGFHEWTEADARSVIERRNAEVIRHLKRLVAARSPAPVALDS